MRVEKLALCLMIAVMALLSPLQILAQARGIQVCHLGVAPLMLSCWTRADLVRQANQNRELLRAAVIEAGNGEMANQVVEALCLGQVEDIQLPGNTQLQTMSWYGCSSSGITGLHTLWNPVLNFSSSVPCWRLSVTVSQKTVIWILPKKCGNLSRLKVEQVAAIVTETRPTPTPPPSEPYIYLAEGTPKSTIEKGAEVYLGTTTSSLSVAKLPGSNIQVSQNGGGAKSSSSAASSSASSASNTNDIHNTNFQTQGQTAISQSQNVVPVTLVVNGGTGSANGTSSGSGNQNAGATQGNNP